MELVQWSNLNAKRPVATIVVSKSAGTTKNFSHADALSPIAFYEKFAAEYSYPLAILMRAISKMLITPDRKMEQ